MVKDLNDITDPFTDALRYYTSFDRNRLIDIAKTKDAMKLTMEAMSRCKTPIAAPQPESHEDSLAVQKPINWNIDKVSKLASILPQNPIESVIEQATIRLQHDIDEHFRGILKRRGISEEEWKQYGSYNTNGKLFEYCYKGECIFKITYPEAELTPGSTEGNMKVYYWENIG